MDDNQPHPAPPPGDEPTPNPDLVARTPAAAPIGRAGGVRLRTMVSTDLPFVVREHGEHFPEGFFARLGEGFLTAYYAAFLSSAHATNYIAELNGEQVGFLVGVTDPGAHRGHVLRRHGRALALKALRSLLLHPRLARLFLRTRVRLYARKLLRHRKLSTMAGAGPGSASTAVVVHVAVDSAHQSRGIGSALIEKFDQVAAGVGCTRLVLVTASGADGAGPYYERHGWEARGDHRTHDGLRLTTYVRAVEDHKTR